MDEVTARQTIESILEEGLPLARAMHVEVLEAGPESVVLAAPLEPNTNPHGTAFGGSIAALATLAAWSWLVLRAPGAEVVIANHEVRYLRPIEGPLIARCQAPDEAIWAAFAADLREGRGRIDLRATVKADTPEAPTAAAFRGTFVAHSKRVP